MTQSELWLIKWQEAIDFLETNHRKPSKFIPEERNLRSWWKVAIIEWDNPRVLSSLNLPWKMGLINFCQPTNFHHKYFVKFRIIP